jgi:hypothetical protein
VSPFTKGEMEAVTNLTPSYPPAVHSEGEAEKSHGNRILFPSEE